MPEFDVQQFEGRIETPIPRRTIVLLGIGFLAIGVIFLGRAGILQIAEGAQYRERSEQNRLDHAVLFAERGIIRDRNGVELAWNVPSEEDFGFSRRAYIDTPGFGHLLGYLRYPMKDSSGFYFRTEYEADVGVEAKYNGELTGKTGLRVIETDAHGRQVSGNVIDPPVPGKDVRLSIDATVQSELHRIIAEVAREEDYRGGAGVIMDVVTGEILAITSYPEFDPDIMTEGKDRETIASYNSSVGTPFLDRAAAGVYTPGSIVKPIVAIGALKEGLVTPSTGIYSSGRITISNPYFPDKESVFTDWRAHGMLDMERAISQSSNVYFYEIGGGYQGQKGLGITRLERYYRTFGYGAPTGIDLPGEASGTIPNPEWKAAKFDGDPWRIGDTYFTSIGQYGVQVTALQAVREAALIATKGIMVTPRVKAFEPGESTQSQRIPIEERLFGAVQSGMRKAVTEGTASALYIPGVKIAAKTGTAELGVSKSRVNSWTIGYFPSDAPRYAFAIVMERGVRGNTRNAAYVGSRVIRSLQRETPDYLKGSTSPGLPLPPEPAEEVVVDVMASSTGSSETVSSTTPSIIPTFPAGASSTPGGATSTVDPPGVFPEIPLPEEVTE